ncbi:hypothetical protein Sps_00136 [Shewanella psychrophila]|uniref:Uncharacterized protein n=1 Tax=Shewanella psychrophila TaxID=225848 RepID=A0A1S6HIM3_9GAMM|nr:hypothetical protein Sps_00136 [Shewanella psychrophila]
MVIPSAIFLPNFQLTNTLPVEKHPKKTPTKIKMEDAISLMIFGLKVSFNPKLQNQ